MNNDLNKKRASLRLILCVALIFGMVPFPVCAAVPQFCNILSPGTPLPEGIPVADVPVVTPDFQLLPGSIFSEEELMEIANWMPGHVMELIPRPGGYQVTVRWDDGTKETRFFSEFSNGQSFPDLPLGQHSWGYTLTDEEMQKAMEFYGEEMTWGEFIERVAPQELTTMDDTILSKICTMEWVWLDVASINEFLSGERLWTMQMSIGSSEVTVHEEKEEDLHPELTGISTEAALISDPYSDTCVFEGDPFEPALIQPELSPQGSFCFIIDPDNPVIIGEYIRDTYPDVWEMLSPDDRARYNTLWAVWPCGWDEPMLPNEVIRLLRVSEALSERHVLQEPVSGPFLPGTESHPMPSGLETQFTTGNYLLQEMRSSSGPGGVPGAKELIARKMVS